MSMQLEVYALSEHLCTVKCEPDWTGQQLKEAIEEATNYKELVGSQQLAVGTSFLSDSDLLKDLDGLHVSLTRRAHPRVRQLPEENLEPLALSLRRFAKSPVLVWVITRGYVFNGNPDETEQVEQVLRKINREYVEEMDWDQCEDQLLHGHLNSEMMDDMVPWKAICGISPDDIAAVLALQACYMWIGDGSSSVAALLVLKDNTLVSVFANVREAEGSCEFADAMVASIETGKTWEELQSKLPNEFVQALVKPISEWTFGPHRMTGEDFRKAPPAFTPYSSLRVAVMQLIGQTHDYTWTCGDVLHKRGIDMGHCSAFEGLWFCPTRPLCWRIWHHRLMFALSSCTALSETWRSAAQEAREQMTRDGLSFSEALDFFQWRFADLLDREMGETGAITTDAEDLRILREVQRRFNEKIQEIQLKIDEFVESGKNLDRPIDTWLESLVGQGQEIDGVWHEPEMRLFVELILDGQTVVDTDRWLEEFSSEVADDGTIL